MRTWLTNAWSQCFTESRKISRPSPLECGSPAAAFPSARAHKCFAGLNKLAKCGAVSAVALLAASAARADEAGGEANLKLPDLSQVNFLGMDGRKLLLFGILFCLLGLAFGLWIYTRLKNLPVHKSMLDVSELIYETCKTYLQTQGKFLLMLWV